jgi:hypothetical protein
MAQPFAVLVYSHNALKLSVCAEYIFSAASHAGSPDGVLVLGDFHKILK